METNKIVYFRYLSVISISNNLLFLKILEEINLQNDILQSMDSQIYELKILSFEVMASIFNDINMRNK